MITVIVAVKNNCQCLKRSIQSFLSQSYQHKELIVIDGGSIDGSVEVLKKYNDSIKYWVSKKDNGISHAWNKGLKRASGEWILFIGSDDVFVNTEVLSEFSRYVSKNIVDGPRVVYGSVKKVFSNGEYFEQYGEEWSLIKAQFFSEKMMIPHQACFHHFSLFAEYGYYDEKFKIASDYDFLLRVLKDVDPVFIPGFVVADMEIGGLSSNINTLMNMHEEFDKALRENGYKPKGLRRKFNVFFYKIIQVLVKFGYEKQALFLLDEVRGGLGKNKIWTKI